MFYQAPVSAHITSAGAAIDQLQDMGISLSVPENALSSAAEPLDLHVRPCFHGPFRLPKEYRSASPAYLISHNRRASFLKDVTIRIRHDASLGNEEDCEDMVFLSASSTPEYVESQRGARPVYTFKEIQGARAAFRQGDQVGEVALKHFCMIKAGKRKRSVDPSERTKKKLKGTF